MKCQNDFGRRFCFSKRQNDVGTRLLTFVDRLEKKINLPFAFKVSVFGRQSFLHVVAFGEPLGELRHYALREERTRLKR